ncbi:MAG: class I SAM-dependent methyltransferase [Candidatus Nanoarchaeia archaeon]
MSLKSPFYWNAQLYKLGLKIVHGKNLAERYQYIANQIGTNKKVLEPACGPAILAEYLSDSCEYKGFDINPSFVKYAKKKGLNVQQGNAIDLTIYNTLCENKSSDIVVIIDSLQHVNPEEEFDLLINSHILAKEKLIICTPFKDFYLELLPNWIPEKEKMLEKYFNYIERDGTTNVKLENVRTRKQLEIEMINGFDKLIPYKKLELTNIGEDLIATYSLI